MPPAPDPTGPELPDLTLPAKRSALAELPSNVTTISDAQHDGSCRPSVKRCTIGGRVYDKPWAELAENEQAAVQRLGFAAGIWDAIVGAQPAIAWALLLPDQRTAAIDLGYSTQQLWDADVPPEPFQLKPWVALSREERLAAIELGHSRRTWGEKVPECYQWEWPERPGPYSIVAAASVLGHDATSWNTHTRAAELWHQGRSVQLFQVAGGTSQVVGHEVVETSSISEAQVIHTLERVTEDGEHRRSHFVTSASDGPARTEAERQAKTRALRKLYPARDAEFKAKDLQRQSRKRQRATRQQQQAQQRAWRICMGATVSYGSCHRSLRRAWLQLAAVML